MKDRIRQLMESQHLTQQRFADKVGIGPASLSSIFNGRTNPTLNHVDAIRKCFPNINLDWLLYGEGNMFLSSVDQNPTPPVNPQLLSSDLTLDFVDDQPSSPKTVDFAQPKSQATYQLPNTENNQSKNIDKQTRNISEIRIFYDDQTWESFVPKK